MAISFAPQRSGGRRAAGAVLGALMLAVVGPTAAAHGSTASGPAVAGPHNPLLKQYFSMRSDDEGLDPAAVSAECRQFLGHPNPYPDPAPSVDVIHDDPAIPNGSGQGCAATQNETTVATNPLDPLNLVAGANDYRVFNTRENRMDAAGFAYTTFDGGRTWKDVKLPDLTLMTGGTGPLSAMDAAGDPAVAFGPDGTAYYANLVFSRADPAAGGTVAPSGMAMSVSHDGGLTWGAPSIIHTDGVAADGTFTPTQIFNDKEWLTVDPFTGAVYVTWTQFVNNPDGSFQQSPIVISRSGDHGRTWSPMTEVAGDLSTFTSGVSPFGSGTNPVVGNDGSLNVFWESPVCATAACTGPDDHDAVDVATSRDGGRTFAVKELARDYDFPFNADRGDSTLTGENFRLNSFPQATVDRVTGQIYVTWADDRNGQYDSAGNSVKTDGTAFLIHSLGQSGTWTAPQQVGAGTDQFFPAVAASRGHIAVSFYTRSYDPSGTGLDYALVSGTDGQIGRAPQHRVTAVTEDPHVQFPSVGAVTGKVLQGTFIGDYTAVAMGPDLVAHPVWCDFRGNVALGTPNQDVYTSAVRLLP